MSRDRREVFRALYEANASAIYQAVFRMVGNREEAEDLTAQVFTKALGLIDWARDAASQRAWLFQVARTTVADYWRARYQLQTTSLDLLLDAGWEPFARDTEATAPASSPLLHEILAELPEHYRTVLTLRFLQALSIKDTAQQMGMSEGNIKVLQFRALKRAAQLWSRRAQPAQEGDVV